MTRKRVVVTGLSAITPVGNDLQTSWKNILAGVSGVGHITSFDLHAFKAEFATHIAGEVKDFNPEEYMDRKQARRLEKFTQYAIACAQMLMRDADFEITPENEDMVGCIIGCGLGGLDALERSHRHLLEIGPRKVTPFMIPTLISNMAPGMISIVTKAKGPNLVTTSACASGTHGIGTAFSEILLGRADVMITGGVESTITPMGVGGFNALRALSTRNDEPEKASRPFDRDRDGFIMGEGCGLLLLESLEHAKERGAKILAEVAGYGASGDAYHMTAPDANGDGMARAMKNAVKDAGVTLDDIDHINAHGTSTQLNDITETKAMKDVFGKRIYDIPITANKSMVGHLLGAAGGVESVFSVMTLKEGMIPGTINLDNPDEGCDLDYCADGSRQKQVNYVLCNSFGFGGTNASMLFKRYED